MEPEAKRVCADEIEKIFANVVGDLDDEQRTRVYVNALRARFSANDTEEDDNSMLFDVLTMAPSPQLLHALVDGVVDTETVMTNVWRRKGDLDWACRDWLACCDLFELTKDETALGCLPATIVTFLLAARNPAALPMFEATVKQCDAALFFDMSFNDLAHDDPANPLVCVFAECGALLRNKAVLSAHATRKLRAAEMHKEIEASTRRVRKLEEQSIANDLIAHGWKAPFHPLLDVPSVYGLPEMDDYHHYGEMLDIVMAVEAAGHTALALFLGAYDSRLFAMTGFMRKYSPEDVAKLFHNDAWAFDFVVGEYEVSDAGKALTEAAAKARAAYVEEVN